MSGSSEASPGTDTSAATNRDGRTTDISILESMNTTTIDISEDPWPWSQALVGGHPQVDWGDPEPSQPTFINWNDILDTRDHAAPAPVTALPNSLPHHPHDNDDEGGGGGGDNMADPDIIFARLSQLSTHLAFLRRTSYAMAEAAESSSHIPGNDGQERRAQLLDDAAFESVAAWLTCTARASTATRPFLPELVPQARAGGGALHDIFSASHHLLEVLQCLQVSDESTFLSTPPASSFSTPISTPPAAGSYPGESGSYFGQSQRRPCYSVARLGHLSNRGIIRNLVIACHTLLLNIYAAVLVALQHDVPQPGARMGTAVLGQIRLVSVVQLCSYLIERQHQAVDQYLSSQQSPLLHDPATQNLNRRRALATDDEEMMRDLRREVQMRLAGLHQTLYC